jgi:hypothetical protein
MGPNMAGGFSRPLKAKGRQEEREWGRGRTEQGRGAWCEGVDGRMGGRRGGWLLTDRPDEATESACTNNRTANLRRLLLYEHAHRVLTDLILCFVSTMVVSRPPWEHCSKRGSPEHNSSVVQEDSCRLTGFSSHSRR